MNRKTPPTIDYQTPEKAPRPVSLMLATALALGSVMFSGFWLLVLCDEAWRLVAIFGSLGCAFALAGLRLARVRNDRQILGIVALVGALLWLLGVLGR